MTEVSGQVAAKQPGQIRKLSLLFCLATVSILTSAVSHAAPPPKLYKTNEIGNPFGLGIEIGGPSGLSGNYYLDSQQSIQGLLAFNINHYILISADYLYHYPLGLDFHNSFVSRLLPYFGIGGLLVVVGDDRDRNDQYLGRHSGDLGVGVRIPLGVEWRPRRPSIGVFVELVPGLAIVPETTGFFQGGAGIRYYF